MLDDRNRELAQVTQVDDVIVSDQVICLMLAQISENQHLAAVFDELFDADGSEVYLRDAGRLRRPGADVTFATLVASARARGETAIGYRDASLAGDAAAAFGVIVNPAKSLRCPCTAGDKLIVLAES